VNSQTRVIVLEAAPLLALAALYLIVAASLAPELLRRRRFSWLGLGVWSLFLVVGALAGLVGGAKLDDQSALGGISPWPVFALIVAGYVPALLVLLRWRDRALLVTAGRRVLEAEELAVERGREADAIQHLSQALSGTITGEEAAERLFDELESVLGLETVMIGAVDEQERRATGFASRGVDADWWRGVTLHLDEDVGAMVTVARERTPLAIYDVPTATNVNRRLADAVGAKSAAFVPLISEGRVTGVLATVTTRDHRHFTTADLGLIQGLANEAALALGRTRSEEALRIALARERVVAEIGRKVRSELDLDAVLQVAVEEAGRAAGVQRAFIRLGEPGGPMPIKAEWHAPGLKPVTGVAGRLPASNLAARDRRTVAVKDVAADPQLADPSLGGRQTLLDIGTKAVLATPILVFDRLIGVFALHRAETGRWSEGEISLAEALAREFGLAIHTARLLQENERRIRQQATLLDAAQVLTSDLRFQSVIHRLVEEVVALTRADAADCWIFEPDRKLLRCRAVINVPEWNVGRQIPPEGTFAEAITAGRTVLKRDFARSEQPPPSPPYAVFNEIMCAPITWLGEVRGVLGVCARERGRFGSADVEVLEAFARFASLALHNAESFEERGRQAQVQRGFYRVAQVLGSPLSLSETLDALAQAAGEALGASFAAVLRPGRSGLVLAGSYELPSPLASLLQEGSREGAEVLESAARDGRVLAAPRLAEDDRFGGEFRAVARETGCVSLLAVPVAAPDAEESGLALIFFAEERSFADDDLALARHLSGAARGALERAELFEGERRARTFAQRLAGIGTLLSRNLDIETALEEITREAPALLNTDAAVVRLLEGEELVVRIAHGSAASNLPGSRTSSSSGLAGIVAQSRSALAVEDAQANERARRSDLLLEGEMRAGLAVPMMAHRGGLYGVLAVYSREPRAWREDSIESLAALAAVGSAAVARAELYQRVAEEKERSDAILANIADGIVAVDREERIVLWNRTAEQITGVPASEALGHLIPQVLQRDLAGNGDLTGERQLAIVRGGKEVWLSLTEAVMLGPTGAVAGRIFAFRDVSGERAVEQMKSDFVSTVSHELRTPLTSIYGFAETLLRSDVDFSNAERGTFLAYIASESERLIRIVDDLLNVARLEAGTLGVTMTNADVGEVAEEVVGRLGDDSRDGHRFSVQVERGELLVRADREKLVQILQNLVDNAVKFSPDGGIVRIAARRRTDTVEISVSDEGIGIAQAEQARVFTKFFRAERVAREGLPGTGLGLFLARGLVAAMGGRIWVESEEGRGSTFTFELPLAEGGEPVEPTPVEATAR
jgi:PAS domain S-box-containing protein